jgi:hypothetical protein
MQDSSMAFLHDGKVQFREDSVGFFVWEAEDGLGDDLRKKNGIYE